MMSSFSGLPTKKFKKLTDNNKNIDHKVVMNVFKMGVTEPDTGSCQFDVN